MNYWRHIQLGLAGLLAGVTLGAGDPDWGATVRDLGHAEYRVREQAEAVLRQTGAAAIPFLESVENSPDPEIRERARRILADIRLGVTPAWPEEWVTQARQYSAIPADQRPAFLRQVAERLRSDGVPFLISRALTGEPAVLALVRELDDATMAQAVLTQLPGEQASKHPELAAWAHREWELLAAEGAAENHFVVRAKAISRHGPSLAELCRGNALLEEAYGLMGDEPVTAQQVCEHYLASGPAEAAALRAGVVWTGPLDNPGRGIEIYRQLCARYPTSPEAERAHYYIATSLRWNEDWAAALQEYRCFLELFPHSSFRPYIEEVILPELELYLEGTP
jgi:hypothetical protein